MSRYGGLSWHETAASRNNSAKTFDEFKYDNLNNKIFDLLDKIKITARNIQDDTQDVIRSINRLSNRYGSVSDYDDYINDMKQVLAFSSGELLDASKGITNNIHDSLTALTEKDAKLMNDLELLNMMIKGDK